MTSDGVQQYQKAGITPIGRPATLNHICHEKESIDRVQRVKEPEKSGSFVHLIPAPRPLLSCELMNRFSGGQSFPKIPKQPGAKRVGFGDVLLASSA